MPIVLVVFVGVLIFIVFIFIVLVVFIFVVLVVFIFVVLFLRLRRSLTEKTPENTFYPGSEV